MVKVWCDIVPLEDDYDAAKDLPFIDQLVWRGDSSCIACGCELEEVGRLDNCVVLECPGCGMCHKGLEDDGIPYVKKGGRRG